MKRILELSVAVWSLGIAAVAGLAETPAALPRSTPEAQGIASAAILDFVEAADREIDALHSFMLVRHGQVVAEGWWAPYAAQSPHELYSLSKSFTSTAVGLAVAEGKLSLDDTILSVFPDDAPADPSTHLKEMRIRDLLRMSTGHEQEPPTGKDQVCPKAFLAQPVPFKPGTRFLYNTAATFMLSAIVQKTTGQTVLDYLKPRLFAPLGIADPTWETNFQGISLGGYGLSVRTEDIARFGQLYLQKGQWQGKQLLPAAWVETATALQTANGSNPKSDWDQGYGYQFWRCRHNAYRGDGAFGQYCLVMPEQDAVIAITSGVRDMQAVLNLVWDKLLPAMRPDPLAEEPTTEEKLTRRLASLALRPPTAAVVSPVLARVGGKTFKFPANERGLDSLRLEPGPDAGDLTVVAQTGGREVRLICGAGKWVKGRFALPTGGDRPVAASGAWVAEDTYEAKVCFYETPFILTVKLRFAGDQLFHDSELNVAFGPTKQPQLVGRAK